MNDPAKPLARLLAALGWESAPALFEEALTHRSYANERAGRKARPRDNQRLEFLGDAVLNLCVSEMLMATFPDADEGLLSRMRSKLVNTEPLADFGRSIQLSEALRLGRGAKASGDHLQSNVLADAVEALVGAAYLDGGFPRARALVERVVGEGLKNVSDLREPDPKSALQEGVQARGGSSPVYRVASADGPERDRQFTVEVVAGDTILGVGRGGSKKLAELAAARDALRKLSTPP